MLMLRRTGSGPRIVSLCCISPQTDGLLSAEEMRAAAKEWLQRQQLGRIPACGSLPQSEVNTIIADFPPVRSADKLSQMVAYQTRQLSGISGEDFVHDFQPIEPQPGQTNPMLIALSKDRTLEHGLALYSDAGVKVCQLASTGLALVNAFEALLPLAAERSVLQLVVEVGNQHAVAAIYWQGRLQLLTDLTLDSQPLSAQHLANELSSLVMRWKETQTGENRLVVLSQLWLTGGGALQDSLPDELSAALRVPVSILGVPVRDCPPEASGGPALAGVFPELTIAYGLALQATGSAGVGISLVPEKFVWLQRKKRTLPVLIAALYALALAMLLLVLFQNSRAKQEIELLNTQKNTLSNALNIIPELESAYRQIDFQQRRMLPVVEIGNRAQRFIETLEIWQRTIDDPNQTRWCIYFADEFSFEADNAAPALTAQPSGETKSRSSRKTDTAAADESKKPVTPAISIAAPISDGTADDSSEDLAAPPLPLPPATPVSQMRFLTTMYVAGIAPSNGARYQSIMELQQHLNASESFAKVDDYFDFLSPSFREKFLSPWELFLGEHKVKLEQEYTVFFLQLPFRDMFVKYPSQLPHSEFSTGK